MARSLATSPYSNYSNSAVDIIEVESILDKQRPLQLHSDYCQTFVNAVWHVQRMPWHLEQRAVTANCHRTVGMVRSYAVLIVAHRLGLCFFFVKRRGEEKKQREKNGQFIRNTFETDFLRFLFCCMQNIFDEMKR